MQISRQEECFNQKEIKLMMSNLKKELREKSLKKELRVKVRKVKLRKKVMEKMEML